MKLISYLTLFTFLFAATSCLNQEEGQFIPGINGPKINVQNGKILLSVELEKIDLGFGATLPIPKLENSSITVGPSMGSDGSFGGTLLQVAFDLRDVESDLFDVVDPQYGDSSKEFIPPVLELGAHVAPTGVAFYSNDHFPEEYQNTLFITLHGSWNRISHPSGYTVVAVSTDKQGNVTGYNDFITGFLQGKKAWGRPSAPFMMSDGSLLVSDDKYDVIYRVTYNPES